MANVRGEQVDGIVNWKRGHESLELLQPRRTTLALLGLGTLSPDPRKWRLWLSSSNPTTRFTQLNGSVGKSVGTAPDGITADVLVVPWERKRMLAACSLLVGVS